MNSKENSTGTPVSASRAAPDAQGIMYDLNDLQSDLANLGHLVDTVAATIQDCDFGPPDKRVPQMDRLNALIWISRDIVEALNKSVDANFHTIGRTTAPKAVVA
ncbi:hypothetical protein PSC71_09185 [Devosia sp. J2-20]|uniref:hypothetical protein n=1 Tax=Devosia sp. J2-20 TaxID=3026161 RepID=UPI00249C082A|nr:hypothetical protein [Devosia sp. J2-20]WDR00887.1 hypothetical protein PSC71_09185 [Devosia sp. J2-20]